jgi:hypothetical protein
MRVRSFQARALMAFSARKVDRDCGALAGDAPDQEPHEYGDADDVAEGSESPPRHVHCHSHFLFGCSVLRGAFAARFALGVRLPKSDLPVFGLGGLCFDVCVRCGKIIPAKFASSRPTVHSLATWTPCCVLPVCVGSAAQGTPSRGQPYSPEGHPRTLRTVRSFPTFSER